MNVQHKNIVVRKGRKRAKLRMLPIAYCQIANRYGSHSSLSNAKRDLYSNRSNKARITFYLVNLGPPLLRNRVLINAAALFQLR